MLKIHDALNEGRDDVRTLEESGGFRVLEWNASSPVTPEEAQSYSYAQNTGMHKHQLVCVLNNELVTLGRDALLWHGGDIEKVDPGHAGLSPDIEGQRVPDKTSYLGSGTVFLKPHWEHIIVEDLNDWSGGLSAWDASFLAGEQRVQYDCHAVEKEFSKLPEDKRRSVLTMSHTGRVAVVCPIPRRTLVTLDLTNDTVMIGDSQAVCWSAGLALSVEVHGEGLYCTYRGTGRILMTNGV